MFYFIAYTTKTGIILCNTKYMFVCQVVISPELSHLWCYNTKTTILYRSKKVIVFNGVYDHNIVPSNLSKAIPATVKQHVSGGFSLEDLADGNILVVGSR